MPKGTPFNDALGTELVRAGDGEAELAIELTPEHCNRRGVAHGGVIAALLDSALGASVVASIPEEWWCATTSLSIQFIAGARGGRIVGHGRVTRRGRAVAFARGEVRDASGKLLATAEGSWHLWPHHPGVSRAAEEPCVVMRGSGERIRVGKIVAVGRNYAAHVEEMNAPRDGRPVLFLKPATALLQDGGNIRIPPDAGAVHHEVELVALVGDGGSGVLGYGVGLDMTLRDLQSAAKQAGEPWCAAKGFDTSAPVSTIAPADEVGDPSGRAIRLDVNGRTVQASDTGLMLYPVDELLAIAARAFRLERGDLLFTGTPAGVGPVEPGDRLTAEIEGIGRLEVGVE